MIGISKSISALTHAICGLSEQIKQSSCSRSHGVTLNDLQEMENRIMSTLSDWFAKVEPKLARVQTGLDTVQALVEKLQNTPGVITPEDQALLDKIESTIDAIANDADSVPTPPAPPA